MKSSPRRPVSTPLDMTQLEDRCTPATLTVNVSADNLLSNPFLTLREAIRTVNNGNTDLLAAGEKALVTGTLGVNDTIQFRSTLVGTLGTTITLGGGGALTLTKSVSIAGPSGGAPLVAISGNDAFGVFNTNVPNGVFNLSGITVQNSLGSAIVANNTTTIDNCIIKDNNTTTATGNGGGISVGLGNLTVSNSQFTNNAAVSGGAIYYASSDSTQNTFSILNSDFFQNTATKFGGAVSVAKSQNCVVIDSKFGGAGQGNTALSTTNSAGGGGINNAGTMRVSNTNFFSNRAVIGGGLFNSGTLTVENATFGKNSGENGGGIYTVGSLTLFGTDVRFNDANAGSPLGNGGGIFVGTAGTISVTNSTISGNTSDISGGGLFFNSDDISPITSSRIVNTTITANLSNEVAGSGGAGGGIYIKSAKTQLQLFNTIVAGNVDTTGVGTPNEIFGTVFAPSTNNLIGNAGTAGGLVNGSQSNIVGVSGKGTLPTAEIFNLSLLNNGGYGKTHSLVQNSLAIGGGSATVPGYVAYDQRETPRGINEDAPDIGAYEVQHPLTPVGVPQTYARTFLPKPSATANEAFIKGLYQSTLLRAPDAAGLANWLTALNANAQTREQIAYGFVNSTENRTNQVTFFYKYFLNRTPDQPGLNNHVAYLQSGADEAQLMTNFILSPEFSGQNNNASFVNLMYYAILGRQADTAGFNNWLTALNAGSLTRQDVVNGFVRSREGIDRVLNSFTSSYLKRTITATEVTTFTGLLNTGSTFGTVAARVLSSTEFYTAAGQNLT